MPLLIDVVCVNFHCEGAVSLSFVVEVDSCYLLTLVFTAMSGWLVVVVVVDLFCR